MADEFYFVGGTYTFEGTVYKDGVIWDLSGATISVLWTKPDDDGTVVEVAGTIVDGPNGVISVTTLADTELDGSFDIGGTWKLQFIPTKAGITLPSRRYLVPVSD